MVSECISVLLPVYNSELYLADAIDSILLQNFTDFKIYILYKKSNDNSLNLINNYVRLDSRVKLIDCAERSLPESLNFGIKLSTGRLIARMDSDDISDPNRFLEQVRLIDSQNLDICGSHYHVINQKGLYLDSKIMPLNQSSFTVFLSTGVPFAHGSVMMRRNKLLDFNLNYSNIKRAEDYYLWLDFFKANLKFGNVNKFLYSYRSNIGSLTKTYSLETKFKVREIRKLFHYNFQPQLKYSISNMIRDYDSLSHEEFKQIYLSLILSPWNFSTLKILYFSMRVIPFKFFILAVYSSFKY